MGRKSESLLHTALLCLIRAWSPAFVVVVSWFPTNMVGRKVKLRENSAAGVTGPPGLPVDGHWEMDSTEKHCSGS